MGIGFGSRILLDLVLFADDTNVEPKFNRSIYGNWLNMESLQRNETILNACVLL